MNNWVWSVGVVCTGALDRLEAEMEENRAQWVEKEEEVREMCVRVQVEVQEKT